MAICADFWLRSYCLNLYEYCVLHTESSDTINLPLFYVLFTTADKLSWRKDGTWWIKIKAKKKSNCIFGRVGKNKVVKFFDAWKDLNFFAWITDQKLILSIKSTHSLTQSEIVLLLICTWYLKTQFWWTGFLACSKYSVQNRLKIQFVKLVFFQIDFSEIKNKSTGGMLSLGKTELLSQNANWLSAWFF